jgi:histidinol-phosphate aminotransferase
VSPTALREKIAAMTGTDADCVVVGAGSVRIIDGLIQTFVAPGEEVLTFDNTFVAYGQFAAFHHRKCRLAPLTDLRCDPENLYPYINDLTRIIFISNPNNPTGTIISHEDLEVFLSRVPEDIIVAVDEAYAGYVTDPLFPDCTALQRQYNNLVVLRSFSKIYGLAGLRLGYGVMAKQMAQKMALSQIPFSVNSFAAGAALAALDDQEFVRMSARCNARERRILASALQRMGYHVQETQANFLYIEFDNDAKKRELKENLFRKGILICDLSVFGKENALRITIGDWQTNRLMIAALENEAAPAAV